VVLHTRQIVCLTLGFAIEVFTNETDFSSESTVAFAYKQGDARMNDVDHVKVSDDVKSTLRLPHVLSRDPARNTGS
jgi:hypothetical protein